MAPGMNVGLVIIHGKSEAFGPRLFTSGTLITFCTMALLQSNLGPKASSRTINSKLFEKAVYIKTAINHGNESHSEERNPLHIAYTGLLLQDSLRMPFRA